VCGEDSLALTRVIVRHDRGRPGPPLCPAAVAELNPDTRVRLEISDVRRARPCSATIQKVVPISPSPTGVRRASRLRRPIVSSIA
jgi:hypothetical protein